MMRKILLASGAVAMVFGLSLSTANAQASRTWVSGVGDDANPCSRTAPCKTFAGAISKTALNGEINCLDPGGFGTVTITKSITIDCHEIFAGVLNAGLNGINIPFDNFVTAGETRKSVRIRNINFSGFDTGTGGIRITGGAASANSEVFIEDVLIDGNFGGNGRGISDERTGGGKLFVTNTTVRNNGGTGISINPAAGAANGAKIDGVVSNVRVENNAFGVFAGSATRVIVRNSVLSGNTNGGAGVEGPFSGGELNVNDSAISNNGTGMVVNA